ncbi:hypothetical protein CLOM_g22696 [Closterium sp. NIES-68]|nr:hypothetical protein CLOM_g22694 [Closterium sp. NIES-68]GJP38230.1 hypothetical protein CLOM_g22696 [Closterium sp. NIES-68]GJP60502.1 hypothetical protein CLOP_g17750 [Closterium sp. NIES-67]
MRRCASLYCFFPAWHEDPQYIVMRILLTGCCTRNLPNTTATGGPSSSSPLAVRIPFSHVTFFHSWE